MDTATHFVMGVSLGGLATVNPVIANDPLLQASVMIATVIGSQAPDFDTVLKLRNNAVYIRNHRGITHSLPSIFIWPLLITSGIALFTPETHWVTVFLWSFIAVFLHVFVDIFNAYGTQALRPVSSKWIALGVINIFDPFIFFSHIVAFGLWLVGTPPGPTFLALYMILIFYYVWRIFTKGKVVAHAKKLHPDATHVFVSPTIRWNKWHLVIRTPELLFVASSHNNEIEYFEQYSFDPIPDIPVINAARTDSNLAAFLSFSPTYRWEIDHMEDLIEVRFIDLRYRSKGHYPFVAIVRLDEKLNVLNSYTGWIFSEEKLKKKLKVATE
ncbi:metal-dependent hydrolase [bacterium LRH843]|nr:metal-dependent hydrolase [bacterium LRH843]